MVEGEEEELEVAKPEKIESGGSAKMEGGEGAWEGDEEVDEWEKRNKSGESSWDLLD